MIRPTALISKRYRDLQRELHAAPRGYGAKGRKWETTVRSLITAYGASSVLDYGCGAGTLGASLRADPPRGVRIDEYDPAIKGKDAPPQFADLVVCTDVLEHIEPECLDAVLEHLRMLARKAIFAVIATRPASKTMSDGRNAHLIIEPGEWWERRLLAAGFTIASGTSIASPSDKPSREWVGLLLP